MPNVMAEGFFKMILFLNISLIYPIVVSLIYNAIDKAFVLWPLVAKDSVRRVGNSE